MTEQCDGPASTVTDEHMKLTPFAGVFAAEVKLWMGPGDPHISTGVMVNEWDLGGAFLKQTYTGDQQEGPFLNFEGRGYWGYNTDIGKYEGFWIDTACTSIQTETGDVDPSGKAWTMVGQLVNPQTGQPMSKRSLYTVISDDEHLMESFFAGPDGAEFKAMEIRFKRKK